MGDRRARCAGVPPRGRGRVPLDRAGPSRAPRGDGDRGGELLRAALDVPIDDLHAEEPDPTLDAARGRPQPGELGGRGGPLGGAARHGLGDGRGPWSTAHRALRGLPGALDTCVPRLPAGRLVPAVRYIVEDVDRALEFYVGRLGFRVLEDWGPVVTVAREDPDGNPVELFEPR